jgi:Putative beta-barrel porin 2
MLAAKSQPESYIMRTLQSFRGLFLCIAAALIFLGPGVVRAEGDSAGGSYSESTGSSGTSDVGLGIFSKVPLHVSFSALGGYDDNVNTTHFSPENSWFTSLSAIAHYDVGTPRTTLSLSTTTGFVYYSDISDNQYEPNLNLTLSLEHKASPRLTFTLQVFASYQTEPDFQYGLGTNRRAGNFFYTQDRMTTTYLWTPRFSTATSYTFAAVHYDHMSAGQFEDRIENTIGNEFRFLAWPTTSLVGEYRFQVVSYAHISRDSTSHFLLGGFDHAFSSRLTTSFRGGVELRDYDQTGQKNSPYFEGTVNYALGKDTSLAWTNRYGIEEGDVALNPTRTTFRTGLQSTHRFTARISASVELYYTHDNYDSVTVPATLTTPGVINPAFNEDTFDASLTLRYAVTRYLNLEAGYNHAEVSSDVSLRDYSRNRAWGGVTVSF